MLNASPSDLKSARELKQSQSKSEMQEEDKTTQMEAIRKVFQDLDLEDAEAREHFRQLAKPSDWHSWERKVLHPQDTRSNTRN